MKNLFKLSPSVIFFLLIIFFLIYSGILIFETSYIADGKRYFTLVDDEMVSMRYAYNLVHGIGLVWNSGDRVEGYTNPIWTLYMALVHLLPIGIEKTSLVIQITAAFCLAGTIYFVKKIAETVIQNKWYVLLACFFTAFYYPLNNWGSVDGTEVAPFTLFMTMAAYLAIKTMKSKSAIPFYLLCLLLGIGPLIRIDFLPRSLEIIGFLLVVSKNRKRIIRGLGIFVALISIQEAIRYWYYGDIFPNTYYLKMTGYPTILRVARGVFVFFQSMNFFIILIPFVYLYFKRDKILALLLFIFGAQILYSIYVGGDAWEFLGGANRYIAPGMPLFFIALTAAIYGTQSYIKTHAKFFFSKYILLQWVLVILIFISLNNGIDNTILQPLLLQPPLASRNIDIAIKLNKITRPKAKIGIVIAGATPYYTPQRYFIDLLGKSEKTIARENTHSSSEGRIRDKLLAFWPGHMKWDYPYVVQKYKPDIFAEVFPPENAQYLLTHGYTKVNMDGMMFYVLKGSKQVIVNKI